MAQCPKCARIRAALDDKTPGWCARCHRWQLLGTLSFQEFAGASYQHLACVQCHVAAWCRDFWSRPNAVQCAREGHVEAFDQHTTAGSFKPKDPRR